MDGLQGRSLIRESTQHHDRNAGARALNFLQRGEAVSIREREVEQDGLEAITSQGRQRLLQVGDVNHLELVCIPVRQDILRQLGVDRVVFDEEDLDHTGPPEPRGVSAPRSRPGLCCECILHRCECQRNPRIGNEAYSEDGKEGSLDSTD